jgi:acyl-CoA oxidase
LQRIRDVAPSSTDEGSIFDHDWQLDMFDWRAKHTLETVARRLRRAVGADDPFAVFNSAQDHMLVAARAHIDSVLLAAFVAGIEQVPDGPVHDLLVAVCDLFVLSTIEAERGWYQEHGRLTAARSKSVIAAVNELCLALRPYALTLIDAFGIPEQAISAPIAQGAEEKRQTEMRA